MDSGTNAKGKSTAQREGVSESRAEIPRRWVTYTVLVQHVQHLMYFCVAIDKVSQECVLLK